MARCSCIWWHFEERMGQLLSWLPAFWEELWEEEDGLYIYFSSVRLPVMLLNLKSTVVHGIYVGDGNEVFHGLRKCQEKLWGKRLKCWSRENSEMFGVMNMRDISSHAQ